MKIFTTLVLVIGFIYLISIFVLKSDNKYYSSWREQCRQRAFTIGTFDICRTIPEVIKSN